MRTILSAAVSLDGYLDDCNPGRLKLSGPEDWAEVLAIRARCDAILVGAGTVRADNPSLVIKSEVQRQRRRQTGMDPDLMKVTITNSGNLDESCGFFAEGKGRKIVFATTRTPQENVDRLRRLALVFVEEEIVPAVIVARLSGLGARTLLVEGGSSVLGMFLKYGAMDILRLAAAPFFVGDRNAPRFIPGESYPWDKDHRLVLRESGMVGDMSVSWLAPASVNVRDKKYLAMAVENSRKSPPSPTAYRVGAVLETVEGEIFLGFTHETGGADHAEEVAISKAEASGATLRGAALYSSMEPCTHRKSKPLSCTDLIISKGISKVVYALAEPSALAVCEGHSRLKSAGVEVYRDCSLDNEVQAINSHILSR